MDQNLKIGIIDGGVNPLSLKAGRLAGGINIGIVDEKTIYYGDGIAEQKEGHGTMCARIIEKIVPHVPIYSIKVLNNKYACSIEALNAAIQWAIDMKIPLLNISLASIEQKHGLYLEEVCQAAFEKKILIVCSKANSGNSLSYPADLPQVLSVQQHVIKTTGFLHFNQQKVIVDISLNNIQYTKTHWIWKSMVSNSFVTACITGLIAYNYRKKHLQSMEAVFANPEDFI